MNAGLFVFVDSFMFGSGGEDENLKEVYYERDLLPKRVGRVIAAGPGPANSAAIGPRLCRTVRVKIFSIEKSLCRVVRVKNVSNRKSFSEQL